ncbi:MAG: response regulator, partial [Proteobacteria bacterium]|nr:response regulator [Pseudomonadota bacterium]
AGGPGAAYLHRILGATKAPPRAIAVAPPGGGGVGEEWMALGVDEFVPDPPTSTRLIQALLAGAAVSGPNRPVPGHDVLAGLRVLLAEDNELTQDVAAQMIRAAGGEIVIAANGAEALQKVGEYPGAIDVVLMDLQMPGMDGAEAAQRLREVYEASELPIIAFTAHALTEERDRAMAAGMNDYLVKPVTRDRLIQALVRHIPGGTAAFTATAAPPETESPTPSAPFDLSRAAAELGITEAVARELANKFRTQYADARNRLSAAYDGGDYAAVAALAHRVRGSAGYLKAQTLVGCAAELEDDIKRGASASQVHDRLVAFDRAMAAVLAAAASLRGEAADTPSRT